MKKSFFSARLYVDGLKQLRLIGILSIIALNLYGVLQPIMEWLEGANHTVRTMNFLEMNPLIVLAFCGVAPLMTLSLFSFLNKRDASDLYHAIPATRPCLFISFFAAIATWLAIVTAAAILLTTAAHALFPFLYSINYANVLLTAFNVLAGGLSIAAAVAIAMSVTGTLFSNILVSLLVIFLPRLVLHFVTNAVEDAFPLIQDLTISPLLDFRYNVPVGTVFQVFVGGNFTSLSTFSYGIYTLVLAMAYFGLALFLFTRRASESAEKAAPNRYWHGLYRLLVGVVLSSVATIGFCSTFMGSSDWNYYSPDFFFVMYLISVLLMPVFDIITTRRVKGLFRRNAVSILLLILINIGLAGVTYGAYHTISSYTPKSEQITSVRLLETWQGVSVYDIPDYFESKLATVELTDQNVRDLVASRLQYSVELVEKSHYEYRDRQRDMISIPVAIKQNGITRKRRILITKNEQDVLSAALADVEGFEKVYTTLPPAASLSSIYLSSGQSFEINDVKQKNELYQVLCDEAAEIGFEKWYALLQGNEFVQIQGKYEAYAEDRICTFRAEVFEGSDWYQLTIPLSPEVLPKTCTKYIQLHTEACQQYNNFTNPLSFLTGEKTAKNLDYLSVSYFGFDEEYGNISFALYDSELQLYADQIKEWAKGMPQETVTDATKPFIYLCVSVAEEKTVDDDGYTYTSYAVYDAYYPCADAPLWLMQYLESAQ